MNARPEWIKPYGAAQLVNKVLEAEGIKAIRPQMMYNYTAAKYNKKEKTLIKFDGATGLVEVADLMDRWLVMYISKKKGATMSNTVTSVEVEGQQELF